MKNNWTLFVASRYIFKGRRNSPALAVLGIATGVLALIVIIAVMNGFQLGFIESIVEISSYHLRLSSFADEKDAPMLRRILLTVPAVKTAVPFREFQAIARGKRVNQQAVLVRGVPENILEMDPAIKARLDFEKGEFDISQDNYVLLGTELARRLGLGVGDDVTIYSISGIMSAESDDSGIKDYTITGVFRTGYYEYDCSWAYVNIESAKAFMDDSDLIIGLKLANRFQDRHALEQAQKKLADISGFEETKFSSWRDYNRSFFGALRTEKLFMFILVGLIFIVVGLNIFQAQRRSVLERREEIGLLRAIGGTEKAVRFVFVCDGAIIGFSGAGAGLVLGLLIASRIPLFFTIMEKVVNSLIGMVNVIAGLFGGEQADNFAVFSPAVFYIKEIPSRIIPHEVIMIFMFGFLSALTAAWFASRKISKIRPAEVLRYE
ncbi:MAG: ABC transporter permease [Treponema sp.]|nr:ABC transporter permease [Treponema sp.]